MGMTLSPFFIGCNENKNVAFKNEEDRLDYKEKIKDQLIKSDFLEGEYYENVFRNNRCVIIANDFDIIDTGHKFNKFNTSIALQIEAQGMLKYNFDIFGEIFQIVDMQEVDKDVFIFKVNKKGKYIKWFRWDNIKYIEYPLNLIESKEDRLVFDKKTKLPRVISRNYFKELMNINV